MPRLFQVACPVESLVPCACVNDNVDGSAQRFFAGDVRLRLRAGTFAPFSRASLSPMATACARLLTRWPELLFSVPDFFRFIADSTLRCAAFPYFAILAPPRCRESSAIRMHTPRKRSCTLVGMATKYPRRRGAEVEIAGVRLTHPDRVLFPDGPYTKRDLAKYYVAVADRMLPDLEDRPLTLVRCPDEVGDDCFYMKHSSTWAPPHVRRVKIREKTKTGEYLIADSLAALISLVQMGVTEIHTWNARYASLETPDRIVFDLDPGPNVPWSSVVDAARLLRATLQQLAFEPTVKTTGGKGLHVIVAAAPQTTWPQALGFARDVAEAFVQRNPTVFTTRFAKAGREGKILIDALRNSRGNTAIAGYSTRARPMAPVAWPLTWDELSSRMRPERFTLRTVLRRIRKAAESTSTSPSDASPDAVLPLR